MAALLVGCGEDDNGGPSAAFVFPQVWSVEVSADAPEPVRRAAEDVAAYLSQMGLSATVVEQTGPVAVRSGEGRVVMTGDGLGESRIAPADERASHDQTYAMHETRSGTGESSGALVELSGGGLLGRQYAAYEWLHTLGVRFFHPEQEFVPVAPRWPSAPLSRQHTPAFRWRSVSLHLTHPLELGDAFRTCNPAYRDEAKRYIDWQIKNLASNGNSGACDGELADYGHRRGFLVTGGLRLWGAQQGGGGIIDADDPRSEEEQIAEAIERMMNGDNPPTHVTVNHQVTEFTGMPDDLVVRLLTFIADTFAEQYPDVTLMNQVHGTHTDPTETFGVNYNTLGQFAPDHMGLQFHTLMFYDVFRPAPVYGNESFHYFFDLMEEYYQTRTLWYFPEAAWWLTFDIPVPLYLPITVEARDRDIQGLAFMLAPGGPQTRGGLQGHHVFGTGHEWGYWQNEYCSLRMAADLGYRWTDCLADITTTMGLPGVEVQAVLEEVVALQQRDLFSADVLRYLVGSDPETEVAATIGIDFHPLPPQPRQILDWSAEQVADWLETIRPRLETIDADYARLTERLRAVEAGVSPGGAAWFREILDGVEVTGLRARHALQVYGACVAKRRAQLELDAALDAEAVSLLENAGATTQAAIDVVRRREQDYRYHPIDRAIAGGPDHSEDENWTVYKYRYLNRTHHAYYYTRIDDLAEEAILGAEQTGFVAAADALLAPGVPLRLTVNAPDLLDATIDFGDGRTQRLDGPMTVEHVYDNPGIYRVVTNGTDGSESFRDARDIAVLLEEYRAVTPARIVEPAAVAVIETLIPGLVLGPVTGTEAAIGFDVKGNGEIASEYWTTAMRAAGTEILRTEPTDLVVPIASGGQVLTTVALTDVVLSLVGGSPVVARGELGLESVIAAIVDVGGFEEEGARRLVADLLGVTPDTLPEKVAFGIEWDLV
jgi:hypothetical protein